MKYDTPEILKGHEVVSHDEWIQASQELLAKEKAFTKARDEINRQRRELPWVKVEKQYVFDTPTGKKSLGALFGDRNQLIVYHFMAPTPEHLCPGCSLISDHIDGARQHFQNHDISYVAISRAPLDEIQRVKRRMGWTFDWVSSFANDFSYDFGVSFKRSDLDSGPVFYNFKDQKLNSEEQPGLSVFFKDSDGTIYRTYSTYERGLDLLVGAYQFIDLTPLGRHEKHAMDWVELHDEYGGYVDATG